MNDFDASALHDAATPNQWGDFIANRGNIFVASKYFIDILNATNDARLPYYFAKFDTDGDGKGDAYVGSDVTAKAPSADASIINTDAYFSSSRNYPLFTESEAYFLRAEAKSRLSQDASDDLNAAVKASVAYVTDGTADTTDIFVEATATKENILIEKWKAMFGQIESYNDYRRTGIPALTPRPESSGAAVGFIPRRFPMIQEERLYNPNASEVAKGIDTPVWWAQP